MQKRIQAKHPKKLANVYPNPEKCSKVLSVMISHSFYTDSHLHPSKPLCFPCKLTILSFQLASPSSIHMDSWWAACNLSQSPNGPKILPKTDMEHMGTIHMGFGLQNQKNQRSTQVGPTNRLNWMPTSQSG